MIPEDTKEISRIRKAYQTYRDEEIAGRRWSHTNPGNQAMVGERRKILRDFLGTYGFLPLADRKILDVGCGAGGELAHFLTWGAASDNLCGVDLLPERIEAARANHPKLSFSCGNAEILDFPEGAFDLILLFTVLSSILEPAMAGNLCAEVARVLKPGGAVLFYDFRFRNPYNPNVHGVTRKTLSRLFPEFYMHLQSLTLLPPLARRLGRWTETLYPPLVRLPFLRTHNLGLLVKPDVDGILQAVESLDHSFDSG
jgi:SAM-dependent methyltransferase